MLYIYIYIYIINKKMMYIICPTCKKLLGDKQEIYENVMSKISNDFQSEKINKKKADDLKQKLIESLDIPRYCCRPRVTNYVQLVKIIK